MNQNNYVVISWSREYSNSQRFAVKNGNEYNIDKSVSYPMNTFWHFSVTFKLNVDGIWYANCYFHDLNGNLKAEGQMNNRGKTWNFLTFNFMHYYLGKSLFPSDSYANATFMFARIWNKPLEKEEITELSTKIL